MRKIFTHLTFDLLKEKGKFLLPILSFFSLVIFFPSPLYALPNLSEIVNGEVTLDQVDTKTLNITASNKSIIQYHSFDIAVDEKVEFFLPDMNSFSLNRVIGGGRSEILGSLIANGNIILVNTRGIHFGPESNVQVHGLMASTLDIDNQNFLQGKYLFKLLDDPASITHEGSIRTSDGGFVLLMGSSIKNLGHIRAPLGTVALLSGNVVTVGLTANSMISVAVDEPVEGMVIDEEGNVISTQIDHQGALEGSWVLLNAQGIRDLFSQAINMEGHIKAVRAIVGEEGMVELIASGPSTLANIETDGALILEKVDAPITYTQIPDSMIHVGSLVLHTSVVSQSDLTVAGDIYLAGGSLVENGHPVTIGGKWHLVLSEVDLAGLSDAFARGFTKMEFELITKERIAPDWVPIGVLDKKGDSYEITYLLRDGIKMATNYVPATQLNLGEKVLPIKQTVNFYNPTGKGYEIDLKMRTFIDVDEVTWNGNVYGITEEPQIFKAIQKTASVTEFASDLGLTEVEGIEHFESLVHTYTVGTFLTYRTPQDEIGYFDWQDVAHLDHNVMAFKQGQDSVVELNLSKLILPAKDKLILDPNFALSDAANYNIRFSGFRGSNLITDDETLLIGDVNGDGVGDLIIGAPQGDESAQDAGSVYVIFSTLIDDTGLTIGNTRSLASPLNYNVRYDGSVGNFISIQGTLAVGDVNGDGLGDLVIGPGSMWVLFSTLIDDVGTTAGNVKPLSVASNYNIRYDNPSGLLDGGGLAIGDVNGDGLGDLIAGSADIGLNGNQTGSAWVLFSSLIDDVGSSTGNVKLINDPPNFNVRIDGAVPFDSITAADLIVVGDVNGDNLGDLILGGLAANNGPESGSAWVIFSTLMDDTGVTTGNIRPLNISTNYNIRYDGGTAGDSVSGDRGSIVVGDVNGDNLSDLVLGGFFAGYNGAQSGSAWVMFSTLIDDVMEGSTGNNKPLLDGGPNYNIRYDGDAGIAGLTGSKGIKIGDVNGDGNGDLVLGARFSNNNGQSGSAFVMLSTLIDDVLEGSTGNNQPLNIASNYNVRFDGAASGDRLTERGIEIGDVNGDGLGDLILGAPRADFGAANSGSAYVIYSTLIDDVGMSTGNNMPLTSGGMAYNIRFDGEAVNDRLTIENAIAIGDVNGDGKKDLAIGSQLANSDGADAGSAWVMFSTLIDDVMEGSTDNNKPLASLGSYNARFDGSTGAPSLTIDGAIKIGDVNGDNLSDLVLGTHSATFGGQDSGSAYVFFSTLLDDVGTSTGNNQSLSTLSNFNIRFDGAGSGHTLTQTNAIAIGDVNGDGKGDLVLGAPGASIGSGQTGAAYVFFSSLIDDVGMTTGNVKPLSTASNYNIRYSGNNSQDNLTLSGLIGIGDVNADDLSDLVLGSISVDANGPDSGAIWVIFSTLIDDVGTTTGNDQPLATPSNYNIRYAGAAASDQLAQEGLLALGDVNGDGKGDLVVGSSRANAFAGSVWVIYSTLIDDVGVSTGNNKTLGTSTDYNIRYNGTPGNTLGSGGAVAIGDVNGDGLRDLVLGAEGEDNNGALSGSVWVMYSTLIDNILEGSTGNDLSLATPANYNIRFDGPTPSAQLTRQGALVIGDVNGDAMDDLIIGAQLAPVNGFNAGAVWVVFSTLIDDVLEGSTGNNKLLSISSNYNLQYAGAADDLITQDAALAVGDVNGDGFGDLLIGSQTADNNGLNSGSAWVIFSTRIDDGGMSTGNNKILNDITSYNLRYDGAQSGDALTDDGAFAVGNVNGDSFDDLIMGSPTATSGGQFVGAAWLVFGKAFTSISGTVFSDEGVTALGNHTISASVNGSSNISTVNTDIVTGAFTLDDISANPNDVITLYLDGEAANAVTATLLGLANVVAGVDLYQNRLIVRHENAGPITNVHLNTADNTNADINTIFSVDGSNALTMATGTELWIHPSATYAPGAQVDVDDTDINGTFSMGANSVFVSGNWDAGAGLFTGLNTVTFDKTLGTQTLDSGMSSFNHVLHNQAGTLQLLNNSLSVGGTFTNSQGTFDANAQNATFTGLATLSGGNYLASTGTQTFNGGLTLNGGTFTGSTGMVDLTNLTLLSGTLIAPTGDFLVSGNWAKTGGTFTPGTGTVTFDKTLGTQTLDSGMSSFNHVLHNQAGTLQLLNNSLSVGGTFTNSQGTFDANTQNATFTGLATLSGGNYLASTGTQTFNGGLTLNGGTFTGSTGMVDLTNLTLLSGTLIAPTGDFLVSGNWAKTGGTFTPGTGTVTFDKTLGTQTLDSGMSSFNHVLHNQAGTLQLLNNSLSVGGTFTNSQGTFDANTQNATFTGLATLSGGNYLASTGTQTFNGGLTLNGGTFTGSTGMVDLTNLTLLSGTLIAPTGDFLVSGNWAKTGGTFTPGTGTVTFDKTLGTQTLDSGMSSFNHVLHNQAGTLQLLNNSLSVGGTFTNSQGTFDANTQNATFTGLATLSGGNYLASTGTQTFNGGLTLNGGTFTGSTGMVDLTNLTLLSGTLIAPTGDFLVSGNWAKTGGTFTPGTGTVTFDKTLGTQTLDSGMSSFNHVLHNQAGTLQLLNNSLSVGGTFTNSQGTFDANTQNATFTGLATLSGGNYLASTGTQTFNGGLTLNGGTFTGSTGMVDLTNLTLLSGTLIAPTGDFLVSGNWAKTGGTFTPGTGTVTFDKTLGTQTLDSGMSSFNHVLHNQAGTLQLLNNSLSVGGTFTNSQGTFDANTQNATFTGLATLSGGNYLASTGTQTFNGGLTLNGGTFTGSTGMVDLTNLTLLSGTLIAPTGDFLVSGNWAKTGGTFTPGTGTVTFVGAGESVISGDTVFFNFASAMPGKILTFQAGSAQTILGDLSLTGGLLSLITLRSSDFLLHTQWLIVPLGLRNVSFVDVIDGVNPIAPDVNPLSSSDSENNIGWFTPPAASASEEFPASSIEQDLYVFNMGSQRFDWLRYYYDYVNVYMYDHTFIPDALFPQFFRPLAPLE